MTDVTQIISQIEHGDSSAAEQLLPLVYSELRRLAEVRLAREKPGQTLQATALVHEAYVRLVDVEQAQRWSSRGHFFGAAAEAMGRILVEQARRKKGIKRGGDRVRVDMLEHNLTLNPVADEVVAVDEELDRLSAQDQNAAEILKLKYYGGLTVDEAADAIGVSRATVYRQSTYARAWVRAEVLRE